MAGETSRPTHTTQIPLRIFDKSTPGAPGADSSIGSGAIVFNTSTRYVHKEVYDLFVRMRYSDRDIYNIPLDCNISLSPGDPGFDELIKDLKNAADRIERYGNDGNYDLGLNDLPYAPKLSEADLWYSSIASNFCGNTNKQVKYIPPMSVSVSGAQTIPMISGTFSELCMKHNTIFSSWPSNYSVGDIERLYEYSFVEKIDGLSLPQNISGSVNRLFTTSMPLHTIDLPDGLFSNATYDSTHEDSYPFNGTFVECWRLENCHFNTGKVLDDTNAQYFRQIILVDCNRLTVESVRDIAGSFTSPLSVEILIEPYVYSKLTDADKAYISSKNCTITEEYSEYIALCQEMFGYDTDKLKSVYLAMSGIGWNVLSIAYYFMMSGININDGTIYGSLMSDLEYSAGKLREWNDGGTFRGDTSLRFAPHVDFEGMTDCDYMFEGCTNLSYIPMMYIGDATSLVGMFKNTPSLIGLITILCPNVKDISEMFYNSGSNWDTGGVMGYNSQIQFMYEGITKATDAFYNLNNIIQLNSADCDLDLSTMNEEACKMLFGGIIQTCIKKYHGELGEYSGNTITVSDSVYSYLVSSGFRWDDITNAGWNIVSPSNSALCPIIPVLEPYNISIDEYERYMTIGYSPNEILHMRELGIYDRYDDRDILNTREAYIINHVPLTCATPQTLSLAKESYPNIRLLPNPPAHIYLLPETVDLGLPSGNLWMKCNVGAFSDTDYGSYFQWGSTIGKPEGSAAAGCSTWDTAPFNNGSSSYNGLIPSKCTTRYNGKYILKPEYDKIDEFTAKAGRLPRTDDFNELLNNCTHEWVTNYKGSGVNGRLFTSRINGNIIFFPAAGLYDSGARRNDGISGYYFASELYNNNYQYANILDIYNGGGNVIYATYRYFGLTIRGIIESPIRLMSVNGFVSEPSIDYTDHSIPPMIPTL